MGWLSWGEKSKIQAKELKGRLNASEINMQLNIKSLCSIILSLRQISVCTLCCVNLHWQTSVYEHASMLCLDVFVCVCTHEFRQLYICKYWQLL